MRSEMLKIAPKVAEALRDGRPVVALESTIIAHGMPYPDNVETAVAVEKIVEQAGAVPATLGVLGGRIIVGLDEAQIEFFGTSKDVLKACERDLPVAVAKGQNAATTAGASIAIAAGAGIRVFVTGGIGGVGPVASEDFDISADLVGIAVYPVLTVCAGTKAFMDVAATLEYLETLRVPVAMYMTDEFPLFYSRRSGCSSGWRVDSPEEAAAAFAVQLSLGMAVGMLLAVPVPEQDALPEAETRAAIDTAMASLRAAGVRGKAVTPFLLKAIKESTGGRSLAANKALIRNNARVGAETAVLLSARRIRG